MSDHFPLDIEELEELPVYRHFPGTKAFVMGPNAIGKSNFLDAIRFLADIAGAGGLRYAIYSRGGPYRLRCSAAGKGEPVEIAVHLADSPGSKPEWIYALGLKLPKGPNAPPLLAYERIWKGKKQILNRPDQGDSRDPPRLTGTHLEQVNANAPFREITAFLKAVQYLDFVPELLRHSHPFPPADLPGGPFGRRILQQMAGRPKADLDRTEKMIEGILRPAIPQLERLDLLRDAFGPHLQGTFEIGRPKAKHIEAHLSDGTLRAVALFWTFLQEGSAMLLESPETSLQPGAIPRLTRILFVLSRETKKQLIVTAYAPYFLKDDIFPATAEEVVLLMPGDQKEGTTACLASSIPQIVRALEEGESAGEAVLPFAGPQDWLSLMERVMDREGDL